MRGGKGITDSSRLHELLKKKGYFDMTEEERISQNKEFIEQAKTVQRGNMEAGRKVLGAMRGGRD